MIANIGIQIDRPNVQDATSTGFRQGEAPHAI